MSTKLNAFAPGAGCYRPAPSPDPIRPLPAPIEGRPVPGFPRLPPGGGCFPVPTPLPHPLPGHGGLRDLINKARSSAVANTQANQLERIQRGVEDGTISQEEAAKLLKQQAAIADTIKRAQADGFISDSERAAIQRQQMQASFGIHEARSSFEFETFFRNEGAAQTQAAQIGSIAESIRSGDLSSSESSSLLRGQADIARDSAEAQADGYVDPLEQFDTAMRQAKAGRDIHREKQDFEKAPHGRNRFPIIFY
jgi:CRISPR/Cas system-associated endoribonuclease Cas2